MSTKRPQLDEVLHDSLMKYAKKDGRSMKWHLDRAVEEYLERNEPKGLVGNLYGIEINPEQDINVPTSRPTLALERGCCALSKPCQHWQFNVDAGQWINTLSGRTKDA